jgi:hypothetical protein
MFEDNDKACKVVLEVGEGWQSITTSSRVEKIIFMLGNKMERYIFSLHVMESNGKVQTFGMWGLYL